MDLADGQPLTGGDASDSVALAAAPSSASSLASKLLGVAFAVLGTVAMALGTHLVAKSHRVSSKEQASRVFVAGNVLVVVVGTVFHLLAFYFAPQALVSPLGSLNIVNTVALARWPVFGGVKLAARESAAVAATLAGCVIVVWAGPSGEEAHGGVQDALFGRRFFAFFVASTAFALALDWAGESPRVAPALARVAWSAVGGVVGGLTNVFAKGAVDATKTRSVAATVGVGVGASAAASPLLLWTSAAALASALGAIQLAYLNRGLAKFSALAVIPVYQVTLLSFSTLSGGVAFGELDGMGPARAAAFVLGIALSCAGVALLAGSPLLSGVVGV